MGSGRHRLALCSAWPARRIRNQGDPLQRRLLLARGRFRWELSVVPLIWCALSAATLWAMDSFDALVPALAGCLVVLIAIRKSEPEPGRKEALEHHLEPRPASAGGASPSADG